VRIHECCRVFLLRHATVQLPEWFSVLNKDFRYQLTVIGQFAQAIVAARSKATISRSGRARPTSRCHGR
jgi:hypothetical protein